MGIFDKSISAIKSIGNTILGKKEELKHDIPAKGEPENSIISALEMQFKAAADAKVSVEKSWFLNTAAILGMQWVTWDTANRTYNPNNKIPDWRKRIVDNKILKSYRKRLAKISGFNPQLTVTPNSTETEDIEAARLGTKVIKSNQQHKLDWKLQKIDRTERQLQCGNVFHTFGWDAKLGKRLPDVEEQPITETPDEGESLNIEMKEKTEQAQPKKRELYEGDIYTEVVSAFELFCLSGSGPITNWKRAMRCRYVDIDTIKALAPTKEIADRIKPESKDSTLNMYQSKIETLNSMSDGYITQPDSNMDGAYLKYVYERASLEYHKGRFIAYANGVLIWDKDTPNFDLGIGMKTNWFEIPFFQYHDLVTPDKTWAQAIIEQQLPLNRELNETESQFIENKNLIGKPKTIVAKGTTKKTAFTSESGEVVEVDMSKPNAFKPYQFTPGSFPAYVMHIPKMLIEGIDDIGSTHDVGYGETQPGVTSGKAIIALQEGDNTDLAPVLTRNSENDKNLHSCLLKIVQVKYTEDRLLKITGEDKKMEVFSFKGAELKDNTDVWVEEGDMIPMTRTEREIVIQERFEAGLLGDKNNDETRKRALRMMEAGKVDEMFDDSTIDNIKAKYENREMNKGIPIIPQAWENHQAELLEHRKEMKTPVFKDKPINIKALYEAHCRGHELFLFPPEEPQMPVRPVQKQLTEGAA